MNLTYLLYLACPIGMGVMMWMMMRTDKPKAEAPASQPAGDLTGLHQQLQSLESQQESIMAEIRRLRDEERQQDMNAATEPTLVRSLPESEA